MASRVGPGQYLAETGRKGTWVAQRMGISQGYLSNLIRGHRRWSLPLRERFAGAVGKAETEFDFTKVYDRSASRSRRPGRDASE